MRRVMIPVVAAATVVTSVAALASAPTHARQVVRPYTAATTATDGDSRAQGSGLELQGTPVDGTYGFAFIKLRPTDRRATIRLADRTGRTVQAVVQQTARDGSVVQIGVVCGRSAKSLHLVPGGGDLVVRPSYGMCGQDASVPTTGKIFATLR
jgi:hypothetical protein